METSKRTLHEEVGLTPKFALMNRISQLNYDDLTVFVQKRVEYNGALELIGNISVLVRMLIIQRRGGGEQEMGATPSSEDVFGTYFPSLGAPLLPGWIGLSDRVWVVQGALDVDLSHRLTNNLSVHSPTVGGQGVIMQGGVYLCWYADIASNNNHVRMNPIYTRTMGILSPVASHL